MSKSEFACWLTTPAAGAVAVLQICAKPEQLANALAIVLPECGRASLRRICHLDEALVLRVNDCTLLVTPHGGPRLRQRLVRAITNAGIYFTAPDEVASANIYCETSDEIESNMLRALARAASPDAIALLLAQPERWKKYGAPHAQEQERSQRLRRLIDPPTVVLVGAANAGKSTLFNALLGRKAAVTSPIAGTTRDFVSANIALAGLVCRVIDAPGLHDSTDAIEQSSIARAQFEISRSDLVIALAAPQQSWPVIEHHHVLRVASMSDLASQSAGSATNTNAAVQVSAKNGDGFIQLAKSIREMLIPSADFNSDRPWQFWQSQTHN